MSLYEDYESTNRAYDKEGRRAICVDEILAQVPSGASILDAGCGTGNYIPPLVRSGKVASYTALDASDGMLLHARSKLEKLSKEGVTTDMKTVKHSLHDSLPFKDNTFDVIIHNQVIHHIVDPDHEVDKFHIVKGYIAEFYRVLKPGGVVGINYTPPYQHDTNYWVRIIPSVQELQEKRHPQDHELLDIMTGSGFKDISSFTDHNTLTGGNFFEYERCFSEEFRNADSSWSFVTPTDLEKFLGNMREILSDVEKRKKFDAEVRALLKERGASTQLFARK